MDLTSLIVLAGLFIGLAIGNAALFGDPVQVQISVPKKIADTGFTETAAEQVFAVEVEGMGQTLSIVETPKVQMSVRPTIMAAVAKPLNLDGVVGAIQSQVGVDVVAVRAVILAPPESKKLDMVVVVSMPREAPAQFSLSQEDGDPTALVRHSAELALEWVSPYRLALWHFSGGVLGDAAQVARAKDIATRAIARPWSPARATENVMLHNLLALMALLDGDEGAAQLQLDLTDPIPDATAAAHGVVELNRSFLAVAAGRAAEAELRFRAGVAMTQAVRMPGWIARLNALGALVVWSRGDLAQAEAMLRASIAEMPEAEITHAYLAKLLAAKGDTAGAAAERIAAANSRRFEDDYQALALSLFWVDPEHGGMRRRS